MQNQLKHVAHSTSYKNRGLLGRMLNKHPFLRIRLAATCTLTSVPQFLDMQYAVLCMI